MNVTMKEKKETIFNVEMTKAEYATLLAAMSHMAHRELELRDEARVQGFDETVDGNTLWHQFQKLKNVFLAY